MRSILIIALALFIQTGNATAGVVDDLKAKPANQYDYGILSIRLALFMINSEFKAKNLADYKFSLDADDELTVILNAKTATNKINMKECKLIEPLLQGTREDFNISDVWPDLTSYQRDELSKLIKYKARLISKENPNLSFDCDQ